MWEPGLFFFWFEIRLGYTVSYVSDFNRGVVVRPPFSFPTFPTSTNTNLIGTLINLHTHPPNHNRLLVNRIVFAVATVFAFFCVEIKRNGSLFDFCGRCRQGGNRGSGDRRGPWSVRYRQRQRQGEGKKAMGER
jgi:hypothetical protein